MRLKPHLLWRCFWNVIKSKDTVMRHVSDRLLESHLQLRVMGLHSTSFWYQVLSVVSPRHDIISLCCWYCEIYLPEILGAYSQIILYIQLYICVKHSQTKYVDYGLYHGPLTHEENGNHSKWDVICLCPFWNSLTLAWPFGEYTIDSFFKTIGYPDPSHYRWRWLQV